MYPASESCGPAVEFDTTRTFWDTTVGVRGRLQEAPLPITVLGWQMELGNFSTNTLMANIRYIDPRITWSHEPVAIVAGPLMLTGNVHHPDEPIELISGTNSLGHLQRENVVVNVTGDPDNGWQLHFRGVDGNFYILFSLDVRDGAGKQWHGETFVHLKGDQLELPWEYTQHVVDCADKVSESFRRKLEEMGHKVHIAHVEPGQPVMSSEIWEAIGIRTLVAAGDPAAFRQLAVAARQIGPGVFSQVGQVSPAPLAPKQGRGLQLR